MFNDVSSSEIFEVTRAHAALIDEIAESTPKHMWRKPLNARTAIAKAIAYTSRVQEKTLEEAADFIKAQVLLYAASDEAKGDYSMRLISFLESGEFLNDPDSWLSPASRRARRRARAEQLIAEQHALSKRWQGEMSPSEFKKYYGLPPEMPLLDAMRYVAEKDEFRERMP